MVIAIVVLAFLLSAAVAVIYWQRMKRRALLDSFSNMMDKYSIGRAGDIKYVGSMSPEEIRFGRFLNAKFLEDQKKKADERNPLPQITEILEQVEDPLDDIIATKATMVKQAHIGEQFFTLCARVNDDAVKIAALMQRLMDANALEKGGTKPEPEDLDVAELLAALEKDNRAAADAKGVYLEIAEAEGILVSMDLEWARKALDAIIENAIKYTAQGGRVTVSAMRFEQNCRIDITDTGKGIGVDQQPRVFDRYWKHPPGAESDGVGMGLYIAKKAVTAMNGNIRLTSFPGQGSTFSVLLPLAEELRLELR